MYCTGKSVSIVGMYITQQPAHNVHEASQVSDERLIACRLYRYMYLPVYGVLLVVSRVPVPYCTGTHDTFFKQVTQTAVPVQRCNILLQCMYTRLFGRLCTCLQHLNILFD